ncbi:MAG: hypothetical protein WCE20_11970 [Rhizomicrobium sp.]|jgi:fluoride ion exporter CrcB/FEX
MTAISVLIGIVIGRAWRWVLDVFARDQLRIDNKPLPQLAFYAGTALVTGALFGFSPFGTTLFSEDRRFFHAGSIGGFVVFRPFAEGAGVLSRECRGALAMLYLLGSSLLMLLALGGGYLLGSQAQVFR